MPHDLHSLPIYPGSKVRKKIRFQVAYRTIRFHLAYPNKLFF